MTHLELLDYNICLSNLASDIQHSQYALKSKQKQLNFVTLNVLFSDKLLLYCNFDGSWLAR